MTDDNPNQPTQNTAGGNIHQDHRRYKSQRDMYVAEGDINIHPPKQEVSYPFYDIRHAQNPNFTGREDVLAELHTQLHQQQTTTVTQTIAGLGGVGKTQLVVEYAHRCKADYDIVAWLGADSELLLGNDVVMLGQALQLVQPPVTDQNAAIQTVRRWLGSTGKRWLLLVDNADTLPPRTVPSCLPTTGSGHILITSRNPNWGSVGAVLRLDVFTPAEAKAFLQRRLGNVDAAECAALAQTLGCFPLAMEHAAAFIEEKQCGVAAYHTYFTAAAVVGHTGTTQRLPRDDYDDLGTGVSGDKKDGRRGGGAEPVRLFRCGRDTADPAASRRTDRQRPDTG